jgi:hypothetical protein
MLNDVSSVVEFSLCLLFGPCDSFRICQSKNEAKIIEVGAGTAKSACTRSAYLPRNVQTNCDAHPASFPMATGHSFPVGKVAGWHVQLTTAMCLAPRMKSGAVSTPHFILTC